MTNALETFRPNDTWQVKFTFSNFGNWYVQDLTYLFE